MNSMKQTLAGVFFGLLLAGNAAAQQYGGTLSGLQEVPPNASAFTGTSTLTLGANGAITCSITTTIPTLNAAHIHRAAIGANGPIAVALTVSGGNATCPANAALTPADVALLQSGGLYFNVHTTAFPSGELRSQILEPQRPSQPVPSLSAMAMIALSLGLIAIGAAVARRRK